MEHRVLEEEILAEIDVDAYRIAQDVLRNLLPHLPETERHRSGGVFCLADSAGQPICAFRVGTVPPNKLQQYWGYALEKAARIGANGDDSSRMTRDADREHWAGAFRVESSDFIGSFSGLPESFDEIFVVNLMMDVGDMTVAEAFELLKDNPDFERLHREGACIWAD